MNNEVAYFGPIVAKFYCDNQTLELFKAQGYKKNKPCDMANEDAYLVAPVGKKVEVEFFGVQNQLAERVEVNDEVFSGLPSTRIELEDGVNEIVVVVKNVEYYLAVYLVRENNVAHENSGGIIWNEEVGYYEFDSLGFFEYIGSFFFSVYEEDGAAIVAVADEVEHHQCCGGNCHGSPEQITLPQGHSSNFPQPVPENTDEKVASNEPVKSDVETTFTAQIDTTPTPVSSFDVEPVKSETTFTAQVDTTPSSSPDSGSSSSYSSYDSGSSSSSSSSSYDSGSSSSSSSSYDSGSSSSSSCDSGSSW